MCVCVCVCGGRKGWIWADSLVASAAPAPLAGGGVTQLAAGLRGAASLSTQHVVCETPSSGKRTCTPQSEGTQRVETPLGKGGEQLSWGGCAGDRLSTDSRGLPPQRGWTRVAGRADRPRTTEAYDPLLLLQLLSHFSRDRLCDPMDSSPPDSSVRGIL